MRTRIRLAGIFALATISAFLMLFGVFYASVHDILFFHAAAVPERALTDVKPLYFALMTLIGGASFGLGLLGMYVTLFAVRQKVRHAATFLAIANSVAFVMAAVTAEKLADATGSPTSWHIMGVLMAINAFGGWASSLET